ncbi:MAG: fumarylacetoacetate hydrolase family protein, partial [Chloroflexota bacterium]|nr:fumarylacetoacetate hydrolase family protein [Chloroflexota bacterium]
MKIIHYSDSAGGIGYASERSDGCAVEVQGDPLTGVTETGRVAAVHHLLAPIAPTNLMCIGLNYRRHAEESKIPVPQFPVLFMKSTGSLQNPGDPIVLPRRLRSDEVDYECELAVVIGKPATNVSRNRALEYVAGYTCANDVSARDWQIK